MQKDRRDIQRGLSRKGFEEYEQRNHTHYYYINLKGNKKSVNTHVSRGTKHKSVGAENLGKMARECEVSMRDFLGLIDCPLSQEDYEEKLKEKGKI